MGRLDLGRPVAVTGGAGAIGSVLVRALLDRGASVQVLDNFSSGRWEHLPGRGRSDRLTVHRVDLRHLPEVVRAMRGVGAVFHLAANPDIRLGTEEPSLDLEHGTLGTFHALEGARRAGASLFAFSSSSVVYGFPDRFPTPESHGPLHPQSLYGASKLAAEAMISAYSYTYGQAATVYRFANIIGPTMTHGVIFDFFEKIRQNPTELEVLGDGRQAKSYLRVEDCVSAMLTAAEHGSGPFDVYNLGTRDQTSVREIAEKVVQATGGQARIRYTGGDRGWAGDIPQQLLDIQRIQGLGWTPRSNSREAVDRTVAELAHAAG